MSRTRWSRREFLRAAGAAGAAGLTGISWTSASAEPPPEATAVRLLHDPSICVAPLYLAAELLRGEGFSKVEFLSPGAGGASLEPNLQMREGKLDFMFASSPGLIAPIDAQTPIVALAGIHGGCYELFGNDRVRTIGDLKGKRIGINAPGSDEHVNIASMMAYIGMDPRKDAIWVEAPLEHGPMKLFVDGKVDVFIAFPPEPQQLRAKKIGHVILDTSQDKPWSQYFCCMLAGRRDFVRTRPAATKRVVRAVLKATDLCIAEPQRAARYMVDKGYEPNYDFALEVMKKVVYSAWRTFDPDATLRFYALRLHEVGMVKSTPQKIIAQGTDWRFLNELKRELKA